MRSILYSLLAASVLSFAAAAQADVVRITAGDFTDDAGLITFKEQDVGTVNPSFKSTGSGVPTVSFGGFFAGQSLGTSCPPGAAVTGCVVGSPSANLSLAASAPAAVITEDEANSSSPVLSGSPPFNGPIAVLFDIDVAGVGMEAGVFEAIGGTAITAYARNGTRLGSVTNSTTGVEFLGLATADGSEGIAGLLFSLVGSEPAGFAIDNFRFGTKGQVDVPGGTAPEPGTLLLAGIAAVGLFASRQRRRTV